MATNGTELRRGDSTADSVAGFLAALALAAGAFALVWYPGRIGPAAMLVALIASALATAHRRFAGATLAAATACWFVGMVIALVTDRPIF